MTFSVKVRLPNYSDAGIADAVKTAPGKPFMDRSTDTEIGTVVSARRVDDIEDAKVIELTIKPYSDKKFKEVNDK